MHALDKKGDAVAASLHDIHNSGLPVLKYNDENSLSCVATPAYRSARNNYRVGREEKSGKGLELKADRNIIGGSIKNV